VTKRVGHAACEWLRAREEGGKREGQGCNYLRDVEKEGVVSVALCDEHLEQHEETTEPQIGFDNVDGVAACGQKQCKSTEDATKR
jgi:hypothetical protein